MRIVEPFAGLGAYSLRALWCAAGSDRRFRSEPPVSRQGSKASFAPAVFRAFGLQRARWSAVMLNDLDPVCHLMHLLYASQELRDATAKRISSLVPCSHCLPGMVEKALAGFARPTPETCKEAMGDRPGCDDCKGSGVADARRLWERIRKTPVPGELVEACAAACWLQARAKNGAAVGVVADAWKMSGGFAPEEPIDGWHPAVTTPSLASRLSSLPSGFASLADLTAAALFMQSRSFQLKPVSIQGGAWENCSHKPEWYGDASGEPDGHGFDSPRWTVSERVGALPGRWEEAGFKPEREYYPDGTDSAKIPRWDCAANILSLPGPGGVQIHLSRCDALAFVRGLEMGEDDVLVVDPPYLGKARTTTATGSMLEDSSKLLYETISGYAHSSARDAVLEICDRGHRAGALVILHEAVGLAKELGPGWQERPASPLRSQMSSFWAGGEEREILTFNRPVSYWPAEQVSMFPR